MDELDKEQEIYVICRTGKRSDLAAQKLSKNGFTKVYNVLPGMGAWNGELIKNQSNKWRNIIMSNKVAIIASNGGLFDAYKVFNIATAAAATEKEVAIFFTFEGLNLIHKQAMQALPMPEGNEHIAGRICKS